MAREVKVIDRVIKAIHHGAAVFLGLGAKQGRGQTGEELGHAVGVGGWVQVVTVN
jgi:hypothetical protein